MINGYIDPYDILRREYNLQFLQEYKITISNNIVLNTETEIENFEIKLVERICGAGMISSIYQWTGSYLIKSYTERTSQYIEEEFLHITRNSVDLGYELKMSFVLFATIGEWLDIVEFKSNELRDAAKIILDTFKHLSFTKAMEESMMEDIKSGKYTKWFEFSMSSFLCLLAHLWEAMPEYRKLIMANAQNASAMIKEGKNTIGSLMKYNFNNAFLGYSILDYLKYHTSDIRRFGNYSMSLKTRKDLIDDILNSADTIVSNLEEY